LAGRFVGAVGLGVPDLDLVEVAEDDDGRLRLQPACWRSRGSRVMRPCLSMVACVADDANARRRLRLISPRLALATSSAACSSKDSTLRTLTQPSSPKNR
jgi:hypothetical protein